MFCHVSAGDNHVVVGVGFSAKLGPGEELVADDPLRSKSSALSNQRCNSTRGCTGLNGGKREGLASIDARL